MKVFLATPAYDGKAHCLFADSLIQSMRALDSHGIESQWRVWPGCCYLPVARNKLVHAFLETDCTDLVFLDSDVTWKPWQLIQILSYSVEIVAGMYPLKQPGALEWPTELLETPEGEYKLREAVLAPTGFMRLRRSVFEKMMEHYPAGHVDEYRHGKLVGAYHNFFDCEHIGTRWYGEDVNFCRKWREIGGQVWIDPAVSVEHHGFASWSGDFRDSIPPAPPAPSTLPRKKQLLIGCGHRREKEMGIAGDTRWQNLVTLDSNGSCEPDIIWDLEAYPWPVKESSVDELHAYHVLEHIGQSGDAKSWFALWNEVHRILAPGGLVFAKVPSSTSIWAMGDPGHRRVIIPEMLIFLSQEQYEKQNGRTSMTDYRSVYHGDFDVLQGYDDGGDFRFVLRKRGGVN